MENAHFPAEPNSAKKIQKELDRKLDIYRKQIELVKSQFPDSEDGRIHEAALYTFQAMGKFHSVGFMRRTAVNKNNLAAAIIAKQQEKGNANQALALLDKALAVFDYPGAHFAKAGVLLALKRKEESLGELRYIIEKFHDDDVYVLARQMKDEIENPPKKGMCFIATAAYGSPLAAEVVVLSQFRDNFLLRSKWGTRFVRAYYRVSPRFASFIERKKSLKALTRGLLRPVLHVVRVWQQHCSRR